jgi:hypothetical protein
VLDFGQVAGCGYDSVTASEDLLDKELAEAGGGAGYEPGERFRHVWFGSWGFVWDVKEAWGFETIQREAARKSK